MEDNVRIRPQQILFDRRLYRSWCISQEILRVAKAAAEKSHQEALAAKKAYIAQHKKRSNAPKRRRQYD